MDGTHGRMRAAELRPGTSHLFSLTRLRSLAIMLLAATLVVALNPVDAQAFPGSKRQPKPKPPVAAPGQAAVAVRLPQSAQPRHGYPAGKLPPVEPPHLHVAPARHLPAGRSAALAPDTGPPAAAPAGAAGRRRSTSRCCPAWRSAKPR